MSVTISARQRKFIEEIASKEGFKYFDIELEKGALKGDGYLGTIVFVKIQETLTKRAFNLVLKVALQGEKLRQKAPIEIAYKRENYMYGTVLNEFSLLQKEYNVKDTFEGTAKYFGGLEDYQEECLALQNLKDLGFTMWDRKKPMDSHHVGAVMAQYGKLHALSHALKKLRPEKFKEMEENLKNVFTGKLSDDELKDSTVNVMDKAFKAVGTNKESIAGLRRFMETSQVFFKQTVASKDRYSVITHGDCWCNNMMFKYEGVTSQKPSKVYLLDWQLSTIGSPILDISYFFYSCSSKLCMDTYNSYLKIYHDSMSAMLAKFGLKVDDVMTFRDLQMQWRIYSKYGMYMAMLIVKIMLTEKNEVPDLTDVTRKGNMMEMFDVEISNMEEYNKRISNIVMHMVKNRFI